jgi:hypothetical protein
MKVSMKISKILKILFDKNIRNLFRELSGNNVIKFRVSANNSDIRAISLVSTPPVTQTNQGHRYFSHRGVHQKICGGVGHSER